MTLVNSRRTFLRNLFVAPAIVAATNLMPVKAFAHLLEPVPNYNISIDEIQAALNSVAHTPVEVAKQAIERVLLQNTFEPNDAFTRARIKSQLEMYHEGFRYDTEYRVVCDETNNTPNLIDRNQLVVDFYLKPQRSIDYIRITSLATASGTRFEEFMKV